MKKLPVGVQNFQYIIEKDLLYVDKTQQIYNLVENGNLYFLPRPRRFGKSLLVSIFKHLFSGNKHLFENLYIGQQTDYDWVQHPVLQFNFATFGYEVADFAAHIAYELQRYAKEFEVLLPTHSISAQFQSLVEQIAQKGQPVVVLIDEYDKPIVDFLTELEKARANQTVLRQFFSPLKDLEAQGHLRFLLITGVSKFSKVSLFSDLNNLLDLTVHPLSHDLLGITHSELLAYFETYIARASQSLQMSKEKVLTGIKLWYNGYSYDAQTRLYNPYSLLNFFVANHFGNFWFATGTPTFLVKTIRDRGLDPQELESTEVTATFFDKFSLQSLEMTGLLFQTGYLTIKKVIRKGYKTRYFLGYPNMEVYLSFIHNLLEAFTYKVNSTVGSALIKMERGLEEGNVELFVAQIKILLSDISYHLLPKSKKEPTEADEAKAFQMWEGYFQTIIYLITSFLGMEVQTEITKHKGRLDLVAQTADFLYLMEFKLDEPAKDAIQQIKNRAYMNAYQNSPKTIYLVGIGFSKKERNVETWEAEVWKRNS